MQVLNPVLGFKLLEELQHERDVFVFFSVLLEDVLWIRLEMIIENITQANFDFCPRLYVLSDPYVWLRSFQSRVKKAKKILMTYQMKPGLAPSTPHPIPPPQLILKDSRLTELFQGHAAPDLTVKHTACLRRSHTQTRVHMQARETICCCCWDEMRS